MNNCVSSDYPCYTGVCVCVLCECGCVWVYAQSLFEVLHFEGACVNWRIVNMCSSCFEVRHMMYKLMSMFHNFQVYGCAEFDDLPLYCSTLSRFLLAVLGKRIYDMHVHAYSHTLTCICMHI